ncbi:MAG TPA: autotransporter-associated beta strand repeat-containing protein, partial [Roseiarcus sp.]|nr:autotransporter-associated beta strand repeat-containing protein [Roseiarcus sp.]
MAAASMVAYVCFSGLASPIAKAAPLPAGCTPATGDNVTVTCIGATFNQGPELNTGYGSGTQNGLTINVNPGASVTGTSNGIDVDGTITPNTINNFGTITTLGSGGIGDVWGINGSGALTVNNSGTIGRVDIPDNISDLAGINALSPGLVVTNNSGGLIQGATAIQGAGSATVTNSGTISGVVGGGGQGVNVGGGFVSVTNNQSGVITADAFAINADTATVINSGTISAPVPGFGGNAITTTTSVTVTNSTGLITSDGDAISAPTVTLVNSGTVSGTGLGASAIFAGTATVINSGSILGGPGASAISINQGSITNNLGATISGDGGIASFLWATIVNAGVISGTADFAGAISVGAGSSITNSGMISAPGIASTAIVAANGGTSIINSGTISAAGPGGVAIDFCGCGGFNTLTLEPGSNIIGLVQAGAATDALQLGGVGAATFDVSAIGPSAQYQGFDIFNKVGASTWTLTGTTASVTPWTINQGVLAVSSDGNRGAPSGGITFAGGALEATASFSSARQISLGTGGGEFLVDAGATLTLSGVISSTGGSPGGLTKAGAGVLTLTGANSYTGGTTISAGTLQLGAGGTSGSIIGAIIDNGVLAIDHSNMYFSSGAISGSGSFQQIGSGITVLSGGNTYSGATDVAAGTLRAGAANAFSSLSAFTVASGATLALNSFNQTIGSLTGAGAVTLDRVTLLTASQGSELAPPVSATLTTGADGASSTFSGGISGGGGLTKIGSGTLTLSGTSAYTGTTTVAGGTLSVTGSLGATAVTVQSGATLGGTGSIGGPVTLVSGGALAPGAGGVPGTITVGPLTLSAGSILSYQLGTANMIGGPLNDLTVVNGALTINGGLLEVANSGSFAPGVYQLIDYSGALSGSGQITVGALPNGDTGIIQTAIPGEVNLVVNGPGGLTQFWDGTTTTADGTIHGGTGTWDTTSTNWTTPNGTINASWQGGVAVFEGAAGTVTVAQTISYQGLEFLTNGYTIAATGGGALTPNGMAAITVANGMTATIAAPITGSGGVLANGAGTLILSGANSYSGGTQISLGTLQATNNNSVGSGTVTLDGGTFQAGAASLAIANSFAINATGGTIDTEANQLTLSGVIANGAGAGALTKIGSGTLILTGADTYSGGTTISAGTLQIGAGG